MIMCDCYCDSDSKIYNWYVTLSHAFLWQCDSVVTPNSNSQCYDMIKYGQTLIRYR